MARPRKYPLWLGPGEKEVPYDTAHFIMWCVDEEGMTQGSAEMYVHRIQKAFETVLFKGTYQLNGVKKIDRVIICSADEARSYTQYMTNRQLQESWIKANYPGAQTGKGFSLTVNIKKK